MPYTAEETARRALSTTTNAPGYCQMQSRTWAGIPARYPDASTAWYNTNDRHPGSTRAPRGSFVYWTGGTHGYGHVAISLGQRKDGTTMVRSTDAGGAGKVATVPLRWVQQHWGLKYAGWAWDNNEQTVRH
jgi:surface antigen